MEFRCERCRYRFKSEKKPDRCPYCGDKGALKADEKAEDLVREL